MVRKQVYILPAQDEQLKHLAQVRKATEAELIRIAIDELIRQQSAAPVRNSLPIDQTAWQTILNFVDQRRATGLPGEPYQWKREDGYEDKRYQRPWARPVGEGDDSA
jgi:hypothetical protein